jgi:hypothetical protein
MKKDILIAAVIVFLVAVVARGTKIQSVDEYYMTHIDEITGDSETVTLSIKCGNILDNWSDLEPQLRNEKYVPRDGVIIPPAKYVLRPNDTIFDILDRAVRHNKVQMEFQRSNLNSYGSVYIQGINYLYEFSCGPLSGWMYSVNGVFPNYGCSKYYLKDGDVVEWVYTCDLGRDVGCMWIEGFQK